ncbi:MAG TPA: type II toxin-antitoxin system VapC family toxin [Quisquiliibacterium sp.]|nr:type II toxin-antitoxin system VapC family toxin [Quisquiliibacterium sp.]
MTIAVDTDVLARLLLEDHGVQHARARALIEREPIFTAPVTVMLELVWVLEVNGCSREEIARGLHLLLSLPGFRPQHGTALRQALAWYAQGLDFADALHLALSCDDQRLATIDQAFARRAARIGASPPVVVEKSLSARQPKPRSAPRS